MNPVIIARAILPASVLAFLDWLAGLLRSLLQGEPLRVVTYGGAVVVVLVTHLADIVWPGHLRVVDVDTAIVVATTAAGTLAEIARRWVASPATMARIEAEHAEDLEAAARAAINAIAAANGTATGTTPAGEGPVDETAKGAPLPDAPAADEVEPADELPEPGA